VAECMELLTMGMHSRFEIDDNAMPLSEAIKRMDEFSQKVTEQWSGIDGSRIWYDVYACKDDFHLFSYCEGEIYSDHRNDERPKKPEKNKNGQTDQRPLTEKREEEEKKKVIIKRWLERPDASELQEEYEVEADEVSVYSFFRKQSRMLFFEKLIAEAEGKEFDSELIFFETYDAESGAFLKKYRMYRHEFEEV